MLGRPTVYTVDLADAICERLASGESLNAICSTEGMPAESTVRHWVVTDHQGFFAKYARAREMQAERWADEIVEIADDGRNDWVLAKHGPRLDHEHVQRSKLRLEARQWLLARILPKKYGAKTSTEHEGNINVTVMRLGHKPPE